MKKIILYIYRKINKLEEDYQLKIRQQYEIHPTFKFNGEGIQIYGSGKVKIGENSYLGSFSTIQTNQNTKVIIGKGCSISHNVKIYSASRYPKYDFSDKKSIPLKEGDVLIGDYVWIGANVFINPGITIGTKSVIGANSVVSKDIEPNTIYGGVPAKLIAVKNA